jgi:hypothetical protein
LAAYNAASAAAISETPVGGAPVEGNTEAIPIEIVAAHRRVHRHCSPPAPAGRSARATAASASVRGARTANSSPPIRAPRSISRKPRRIAVATDRGRIARLVPELIVDTLQAVQVHEQQRERLPISSHPSELVAQFIVKRPWVEEAGERIGRRDTLQPIGVVAEHTAKQRERRGRRHGRIDVGLSIGPDFFNDRPHRECVAPETNR